MGDMSVLAECEGVNSPPAAGQALSDLVVIEDKADALVVSHKRLLKAYPVVRGVDDLSVGLVCAGVVRKIEKFGAFISFAQGFSALCPSKEVSPVREHIVEMGVGE